MRKILLIALLILTANISAQENYSGRISLTFNDEKIDLPINSVMLRKEDKINISIQAERNEDTISQRIGFELVLKNLEINKTQQPSAFRINVNTRTKKDSQFEEFRFDYLPDQQVAYYGFGNDIEKATWNINSLEFKIGIEEITYSNKSFIINGIFNGIFRSLNRKGEPRKDVVEIKNGKFEIVI